MFFQGNKPILSQLATYHQASLTIFGVVGGPLLGLFTMGVLARWSFETFEWKHRDNYRKKQKPTSRRVEERGAIFGFLTGLAFVAWIGFGGPKPPPEKLPVSISNCTFSPGWWVNLHFFIHNVLSIMEMSTCRKPLNSNEQLYTWRKWTGREIILLSLQVTLAIVTNNIGNIKDTSFIYIFSFFANCTARLLTVSLSRISYAWTCFLGFAVTVFVGRLVKSPIQGILILVFDQRQNRNMKKMKMLLPVLLLNWQFCWVEKGKR